MNVYTHTLMPSSQWALAQSQMINCVAPVATLELESRGRFLTLTETGQQKLSLQKTVALHVFLFVCFLSSSLCRFDKHYAKNTVNTNAAGKK